MTWYFAGIAALSVLAVAFQEWLYRRTRASMQAAYYEQWRQLAAARTVIMVVAHSTILTDADRLELCQNYVRDHMAGATYAETGARDALGIQINAPGGRS